MFVGKDDKCNTYSKAFSLHANSFMGTAETAHYCFDFFFLCIIWQYGNLIVSTEVVQCQFKYKE